MNHIQLEKYITEIEELSKTNPEKAKNIINKMLGPKKKLSRKQKKYRKYKEQYRREDQLRGFNQLLYDTFINKQKDDLYYYFPRKELVLEDSSKEYARLKELLVKLACPSVRVFGHDEFRQLHLWDYSSLFDYIELFNRYRDDFKFFDQVWDSANPYKGNENQLDNPEFIHELAIDKMEREWRDIYHTLSVSIFFAKNDTSFGDKAKEQLFFDMTKPRDYLNLEFKHYLKDESPDNLIDYDDVLHFLPKDDRYNFHKSFDNAKKILEQYTPVWAINRMDHMDEEWLKQKFDIKNFYLPKDYQELNLDWHKVNDVGDKLELALANKTIEFALLDKKIALLIAGFIKSMASQSNHWHQCNRSKKVTVDSIKKMRQILIDYCINSEKSSPIEIQQYFINNFRAWWD